MAGCVVAAVMGAMAGCSHGNAEAMGRGVEMKGFVAGKTVLVGSLAELQQAVDAARPGDEIVLAKGTYTSDGPVTINCAGRQGKPVVVRAQEVGDVEIKGKAGFTFGESAQWAVVEGFKFAHSSVTMLLPAGTKHLRVTRNEFALQNDVSKQVNVPTIEVSGDDCEIDHNFFHDKATQGCWVTVQGPGKEEMAQRTWIHHNEFKNFVPTANNCSAIQVGLSWRSMHSGFALVEHNLFIKCRGENEGLVCNKSCDNTYRYNTAMEGTRELSLRHGNRCQVYGNYFLNTDGLRFFGHDHRIYSNYFEGCRPAIHVGNGDATIPPGRLQMHDEPVGVVVAFNTLMNNQEDIIMSPRGKPYGAANVTIADNVIVGGPQAADIQGPMKGAAWEGNVVWKTEVGSIPAGGFVKMDPGLEKGADGIWRPGAGSAVVGKAVGNFPFVTVDVDGRGRGAVKDVGASQVGGSGEVNRVLTERDVGPGAE